MILVSSFLFFLFLFLIVGVLSTLKSKGTTSDYLMARQSVSAPVVALSAVSTNNSGYMFIGMIGYTYHIGLSSIWLMIGWIVGDLVSSFFVHKHMRTLAEENEAYSFGGVIAACGPKASRFLRPLTGFITIIFLGTYAAAQLGAGSKALHVLFDWPEAVGALLGGFIVLLYSYAGGIRASFWTDVAQSAVMFASMVILMFTCIRYLGGTEATIGKLEAISPTFLSVLPYWHVGGPYFGALLFIVGWFIAGIAVVGQPHIMLRFMAMKNVEQMTRIRAYYYSWYTLFYCLTIVVGLCARVILAEAEQFDAELALPMIAMDLLPAALAGLALAGLFAATMSTADSQILSCTAAATLDFNTRSFTLTQTKCITALITALAVVIAIGSVESIFNLVVISWAALGSAFAPILLSYSMGARPSENCRIAMIICGLGTMLLFRQIGGGEWIYEVFPGMAAGFLPLLSRGRLSEKLSWDSR
ncbi:MAG: sodium:proline symporter [Waddliaceae bacterium]|nr:sodium:proline symporter [Waddliaceae bacterium]